ncbi:MAG TPA: tetratricopeptide repeat protein, partial [Puia sp.]|nr:tetratricopeptide repeat protein [Puia sp.]
YQALKFDDAIYWFSKSIENHYRITDSYRYMGASKALIGDFKGSKENLFYSYQLDSFNERTYYHIGKYYFLLEKYDSAIFWITNAINKNPKDPVFYDTKALSYLGVKKLDSALLNEQIAIKLRPDETFINNRGLIKQKQLKYNEALSDYQKTLSIDSSLDNNTATFINMAFCYLKLKKYKEALQACNRVLTQYPEFPQGLEVRGQTYYALAKKEEACIDFRHLSQLDRTLGKEYLEKFCK